MGGGGWKEVEKEFLVGKKSKEESRDVRRESNDKTAERERAIQRNRASLCHYRKQTLTERCATSLHVSFFSPLLKLKIRHCKPTNSCGLIIHTGGKKSCVLMQSVDKTVSNSAQCRIDSVLYSSLFLPPVMVI